MAETTKEQAKLYNKYIAENNSLPVGKIRSKLPVLITSCAHVPKQNTRDIIATYSMFVMFIVLIVLFHL